MRTVVIAALERELRVFVHGWPRITLMQNGRSFRGYVHKDIVAVASGIGYDAARLAAQAATAQHRPETLVSAGVAGALVPNLKIGSVVTPGVIFEARTGAEYRCETGAGALVSAGEIVGLESKRILAEKFHALCVDMEAAAVAQVAQQQRIAFCCVKTISDEADSVMPPLTQFVDENGVFQTGRFIVWVALRPRHWGATILLARNSRKACKALCSWLNQHFVDSEGGAGRSRPEAFDGTRSARLEGSEPGPPGSKA